VIEAAHEHSLVGRRRQLDRFHRWIDEVTVGRGAAVLVEGEPGIGKTSLVRAATVSLSA